jgi:hypothetical protein
MSFGDFEYTNLKRLATFVGRMMSKHGNGHVLML